MKNQRNIPDQATLSASQTSSSRASWTIRLFVIFIAVVWLVLVAATWADAAEESVSEAAVNRSPASGEPAASSEDSEYSFNWLDPDKKIYVLQNRKYTKAGHAILSLMGGTGFSNPFRSTYDLDARLAVYLTETWGIEGFYTGISNSANSTYNALLVLDASTPPNIREILGQYGALLHYVPWYAKINVFNTILYFDWYFAGGVGNLNTQVDTRTNANQSPNYVSQSLFAIFGGTGMQFHLSQRFLFRLDVTDAFYDAPVLGTDGTKAWFSNLNMGLGIGLKI